MWFISEPKPRRAKFEIQFFFFLKKSKIIFFLQNFFFFFPKNFKFKLCDLSQNLSLVEQNLRFKFFFFSKKSKIFFFKSKIFLLFFKKISNLNFVIYLYAIREKFEIFFFFKKFKKKYFFKIHFFWKIFQIATLSPNMSLLEQKWDSTYFFSKSIFFSIIIFFYFFSQKISNLLCDLF